MSTATFPTAFPLATPVRRRHGSLRSTCAVLAGFVTVVALALATDQAMHALEIYPPWGQSMPQPGLNLLALAYRSFYAVLGSYIAARLAQRAPMRHALILGAIGFLVSIAGALAAIAAQLDPLWYPLALVVTTLPCAWLGGALARARRDAANIPSKAASSSASVPGSGV